MGSLLNISERGEKERFIISWAGNEADVSHCEPSVDSSFSRQSWLWFTESEKESGTVRKRGLRIPLLIQDQRLWLCVNNLLRKQAESQLFVEHVCNLVQFCADRNAGILASCSTQRRRLRQGNVLFDSHSEKERLLFNLKSIWKTERKEKWKSVRLRVNKREIVKNKKALSEGFSQIDEWVSWNEAPHRLQCAKLHYPDWSVFLESCL